MSTTTTAATPGAERRDRRIPLLIAGIVVAGALLLASIGATAVAIAHAKMGVFDDGPTCVELRHAGGRWMERSEGDGRAHTLPDLSFLEGLLSQRGAERPAPTQTPAG